MVDHRVEGVGQELLVEQVVAGVGLGRFEGLTLLEAVFVCVGNQAFRLVYSLSNLALVDNHHDVNAGGKCNGVVPQSQVFDIWANPLLVSLVELCLHEGVALVAWCHLNFNLWSVQVFAERCRQPINLDVVVELPGVLVELNAEVLTDFF